MVEEFEIKLATIEDMKDVFDLSNDKLVRANSINTEQIKWENHQIWFKNKTNDENCIFYTLNSLNNGFIGYVRLDKEDRKWVLTIHLLPNYRGKGLGSKILETICTLNSNKCIIALVKENNLASLKSFKKAKFRETDFVFIKNERYHKLEYEYNCNK